MVVQRWGCGEDWMWMLWCEGGEEQRGRKNLRGLFSLLLQVWRDDKDCGVGISAVVWWLWLRIRFSVVGCWETSWWAYSRLLGQTYRSIERTQHTAIKHQIHMSFQEKYELN